MNYSTPTSQLKNIYFCQQCKRIMNLADKRSPLQYTERKKENNVVFRDMSAGYNCSY